jgi:hypothetical protein
MELNLYIAEPKCVPIFKRGLLNPRVIYKSAVRRTEIENHHCAILNHDLAVRAGDTAIINLKVVLSTAAYGIDPGF